MFRFSIRELMLVTLVTALIVGWCLDHGIQAASSKKSALEAAKWKREFRDEIRVHREIVESWGFKVTESGEPGQNYHVHYEPPPELSSPDE